MDGSGEAISILLLIRLFQVTTTCSVRACFARPSQRRSASFSSSSPTRRPASSTWPRAAGPRVTSVRDVPTLAATRWWDQNAGSVPPVATSLADLADCPSQYQDPADPLVLGRLPDDHRQAGCFGTASPAPAWASALRNRLDDASQAPRAMVNVAREPLWGEVEIDDTWVGGIQAGLRGSRQLKGRRAALVLVAVEKRGPTSGRIRMAVIPDFKATTINDFLIQNVAPGSTIFTDGLKTFTGLDEIFHHIPRTQPLRTELHQGAKSVVPLADRAIGNLQQWLLGTHHGVSRAQLQVYLDEFVFREIAEGNPWRPSRRSSASEPCTDQRTTTAYAAPETFETACPRLTTTYSASLKQPDKQEHSNCSSPPDPPAGFARPAGDGAGLSRCGRSR